MEAAADVTRAHRRPIAAYVIGPARDAHDIYDDWARAREVEEIGCVLVRPDAHVAWRAPTAVEDPTAELGRVMESLLGRVGTGGRRDPMIERESAAPAGAGPADATADVVVVGGGGGGLPAALFARWLGDEVILLEKAPELGGTAKKAAFWYWVPNNRTMREAGIEDPEEDFLRYTARLSRPQQYDPSSPTLGLSEWEHAQIRAIYESASPAAELLAEKDALPVPLVRGGAGLLVRAARGQGADRPRARARGRAGDDVRRRPGRHPHDERGGRARRRRHPRLAPRPAARDRGRRAWSASRRPTARARPCAWPRARR